MNVFAIIIAVKHHKNPCEVSTAVRGNPCDINTEASYQET